MTATQLLRNARLRAGMTQSALADRSGVAQSTLSQLESGERVPTWTTIDRILQSTGSSLIAIPTRRADASRVAAQIGSALIANDTAAAVRHFIQLNDDLAAEHGSTRFALTISDPPTTGSKRWDAALAALAAYRLAEEHLPEPFWVTDPGRRLGKSWTFGSGRYNVEVPHENVPPAFLERGVLIDRETLESV
jgi:transcriptional regulator with XRE-family HTH domain